MPTDLDALATIEPPPIGRDTLSQQVYFWLRKRILTGAIEQGARLSELGISKELNVSATPVREALRLLSGDGLVHYEGRRGVRVIEPTCDEIRHCYAVRQVLEALALREACPQLGPADIERLRALAADGDDDRDGTSPDVFIEADRAFHGFFVERSGNVWLQDFHAALTDFLLVVRRRSMRQVRVTATVREHIAIAEAVAAGNTEKAVAILENHIAQACGWALDGYRASRPAEAPARQEQGSPNSITLRQSGRTRGSRGGR